MLSVNFFCNISSYNVLSYITKNYIALIYYAKIVHLLCQFHARKIGFSAVCQAIYSQSTCKGADPICQSIIVVYYSCYCFLILFIVVNYPLTNEVAKGYSNATVSPQHPCEHSRINIIPVKSPPLRGSLPRKSLISRMDWVSYAGDINLSTHLFLPHDLPPTKKSSTKFRLMGRFYCHTEKKSLPRRIFEENKNSNLPPNLSFQACQ